MEPISETDTVGAYGKFTQVFSSWLLAGFVMFVLGLRPRNLF